MDLGSTEERLVAVVEENARLKDELNRANARARSAREEFDAFVYAASHDLKQPLRSISSYAQLLVRMCGDNQDAIEYSGFIIDGVSVATTLIEQLLTFSRAGSSRHRVTTNVASVVQAAVFKLQPAIQKAGATVSFRDLPEVSVNPTDFERVFENLIDNAIKYAGEEPIRVDISADDGDEGHIISVGDNGSGIQQKFHEQVFQPFKRLHGKNIPGSGLGLAMCRKIVEAQDGRIWVESDGKNGSVFKISLPY
ncbi:MAG: GHKL domain-containing protein [Acidobacteriia bacterium]|nr:GHKL domain-containing protein [Terriglobia bacterium]